MIRWGTGLVLLAIVGGISGAACQRRRNSAGAGTLAQRAQVEWAGCAVARVGPHCELGVERQLTLWTAAADAPTWRFLADGHLLDRTPAVQTHEGWSFSVDVPRGAHRLSAMRPGEDAEAWGLAVGDATLFPELDALVKAGKAGQAAAAGKLKELALGGDPAVRGPADAGYARVMLARGEMNEAEAAFRRALKADRAEGRASDEMRDGDALIWGLAEMEQRFADAREALSSLTTARDSYPEGGVWYAKNEGLLAAETYDFRGALAGYRAALRLSEKLGRTKLAKEIAQDLARILNMEGRSEESIAILDRLPLPDDPCARATLLINRAAVLTLVPVRSPSGGRIAVQAVLSDEQRATHACTNPHGELIAILDAARYALMTGDRAQADAQIERLKVMAPSHEPMEQVLRGEALGAWALERGKPREALSAFEAVTEVARAAGLESERLDIEVGAGRALLLLGRRAEGIERLHVAQRIELQLFENIPLMEGRGKYLSSHDDGVRHLTDALVDGREVAQAMAAVRAARAAEARHAAKLDRLRKLSPEQRRRWDEALERHERIRRAIEQEAADDWKLPVEMLAGARADRANRAQEGRTALDDAFGLLVDARVADPPAFPLPARDEVEVALARAVRGWVVFVRTRSTVEAHRFSEDALGSNAAAAAVLALFSPRLAVARRVVILASGLSDQVDWHTVAWQGEPLIAKRQVLYKLDLPAVPESAHGEGTPRSALVLTNPSGNLASARREGDMVAGALRGWSVTRFDGPAATRAALLDVLPKVALFHFAGHAEISQADELAGGLVLAGGAHADAEDLLGLPRVPSVVVLAACRAAATRPASPDDIPTSVMGLAQIFLAGGAQSVVAPMSDVDDADTARFMARLYDTIGSDGLAALPEGYRRAALEAVGKSSATFRLIVP